MSSSSPERLTESARRTVSWLCDHIDQRGALRDCPVDLAAYYKVPYLLQLAGEPRLAHRVLDFVAAMFMQPDGDFATPGAGKTADPVLAQYHGYTNGWLLMAAWKMGRFDVGIPAWRHLRAMHHPGTGASTLSGPYQPDGDNVVEMLSTAHLGLAALYCSDIDMAVCAGRALVAFFNIQPQPGVRMLLRFDDDGRPMVDVPAGAAGLHVVEASRPGQAWFFIGYPIAFLTKLYQATGEQDTLEAARAYAEFALSSRTVLAPEHFAHKVAWGAALLARATGDSAMRDLALDIANHRCAAQSARGTWMDDQPPHACFDQSAEVAIWLLEIAALL